METPGGCGFAAEVSILAEDGITVCFSDVGNVPTSPVCGSSADIQDLNYTFDPSFPAACNATFNGTIPAACASFCITDPCGCNDDQLDNVSGSGDGSFSETVEITGLVAGETWTVTAISSASPGTAPSGINAGDLLNDDGGGAYSISFSHFDGAGYTIMVEGPGAQGAMGNATFTLTNTCIYPAITTPFLADVEYCVDETAVTLPSTGNDTGGNSGGYTYTIDGANVSSIDPPSLGPGSYMLNVTFDGDFINDDVNDGPLDPAYPGCLSTVDVPFEVFALPDPSFTCPTTDVPQCDGVVALSPVDNTGTWSGTAANFVNGNNEFDPLLGAGAPLNVDLTLIYSITDGNGCSNSETCIIRVVNNCAADGGRFDDE